MTRFTIKEICDEEGFAALAQPWQALAAQDNQAAIFNDWQWNSLWWEHYKHLGELYVLVVYLNDDLVGLAPLYRNRGVALKFFKQTTAQFIGIGGDTSPDDVNILAAPEHRQQVVGTIWDHLIKSKFERFRFVDLPKESPFNEAGLQRCAAATGYTAALQVNARYCADLPEDWAGFRQQISRNTFKQMKRRQNRLDSLGNIRFERCETTEQVAAGFDALVRLHNARWESKGEGGAFSTDAYLNFHKEFISAMNAANQLWLITLKADDQIVAVEYAFEYKKTLMFFQTGFDPNFDHLNPGHVLMTHAIKSAIDSGLKRIDLLKGDYAYKTSYANQQVESVSWTYYTRGVVGGVAWLRDKLKG